MPTNASAPPTTSPAAAAGDVPSPICPLCRAAGALDDLAHVEADCPRAHDRCAGPHCHHLRLAHVARRRRGHLAFPAACAVMICACEQFRGEADR